MTSFVTSRRSAIAGLISLALFGSAAPAIADYSYESLAVRGAINHVLYHVIYRAAEAAREEAYAVRNDVPGASPIADDSHLGREARLELKYIHAAHDKKVTELETRFYRQLTRLARAFERKASRARTTDQVWDLRYELEPKVARAHAAFRRDLAEEDRHYRDLRARVLRAD